MLPARLEQAVGALDVGPEEGLRVRDGVVVVGLGREVDDGVVAGDHLRQERRVADVAHHELDAGHALDVGGVPRVGELVEHRHAHARAVLGRPAHEVAADEAAAPCDYDVHRKPPSSAPGNDPPTRTFRSKTLRRCAP